MLNAWGHRDPLVRGISVQSLECVVHTLFWGFGFEHKALYICIFWTSGTKQMKLKDLMCSWSFYVSPFTDPLSGLLGGGYMSSVQSSTPFLSGKNNVTKFQSSELLPFGWDSAPVVTLSPGEEMTKCVFLPVCSSSWGRFSKTGLVCWHPFRNKGGFLIFVGWSGSEWKGMVWI